MDKQNNFFGLAATVILPASLFVSCGYHEKEAGEPPADPNFIYIIADDLGYGDLGCYGQEDIKTPNIDRMAARGMLFTQHYSGSTVCAPSRSVLMTGKHTGHTQVRGNREIRPEGQFPLKEGTVTIASLLKEAGYVTGAFGKWGLGYPGSDGDPVNQGFDVFFGYNCQRYAHRYYPEYIWHNEEKVFLEGNDWNNTVTYAPDVIHDKTLDFIRDNADTSFFLFVPSLIPHAELIVPEDGILEMYRGEFPEVPWGFDDPQSVYQGNAYGSPDFNIAGYCPQSEPRAVFAAMVTRLDRQVGDILKLVEEMGIEENTLVIFTSDNGPHSEGGADPAFFNSNGIFRGQKRDLYEGGIRVPFIAWWPGTVEYGSRSDHISAFWDMMPTFSELAGIEAPDDIDGISIVPELTGLEEQQEHEYLYWEFMERGGRQAVRIGDWKAVRLNMDNDADAPIELYNLASDPGETTDMAKQNPETVSIADSIMKEGRSYNPNFTFAFERDRN
ncbi:MAG: arylsulfatase [Bacteroidales bacterium]